MIMILFQIFVPEEIQEHSPAVADKTKVVIPRKNYDAILEDISKTSGHSIENLKGINFLYDREFVEKYGGYLTEIAKAAKEYTILVFSTIPKKLFEKYPEKILRIAKAVEAGGNVAGESFLGNLEEEQWLVFNKLPRDLFEKYPEKLTRMAEAIGKGARWAFEELQKDFFEERFDEIQKIEEEYNLELYGRYRTDTLEYLYNNIGKRTEAKTKVLVILSKFDSTGAFFGDKELYGGVINNNMELRIIEAGNETEFIELAEKMNNRYGPFGIIIIGGPGKPTKIRLGVGGDESNFLDITDSEVIKRLQPVIEKDGDLVLMACSTGDPNTTGNIAKTLSKKLGITVFAPDKPADIRTIYYKQGEKGKFRVKGVEYTAESIKYEKGKRIGY